MNPKVDEYINNLKQDWWRNKVKQLREAVHRADPEIKEDIKWGSPYFEHGGKVAWLFCATEWVHFAFLEGALLDHKHGLFEPVHTKATRAIKLGKDDPVPTEEIVRLTKQAVANNLAGRKIKFEKAPKQKIILPDDIKLELASQGLEEKFWQRPYYQQKGYLQWIEHAKQDATRSKRINMMITELQADQYMPPKKERLS